MNYNMEKLQHIIKEQENIIKKQQKKIMEIEQKNEKYCNEEYYKYTNEKILKEIIKYLEICINYINKDTENYSIYGNFFESLISNISLKNKTIFFYVINYHLTKIEGLCEIFKTLNLIKNTEEYNLLNIKLVNNEQIYYYGLNLNIKDYEDYNIQLIIHDCNYMAYIDRSSKNITINNYGISNMIDLKTNNLNSKISSLDVLVNLYNLSNKKIQLYYNENMKNLEYHPNILNYIDIQKYYQKQGIEIINKLQTKVKECPVCFDNNECVILKCNHLFCKSCLETHLNNDNYNNKTCPLCRANMELK